MGFLLAPCKEDIYLNFPGRYKLPKGKCLKCRSYVYGLKQSAARWHELFSGWLSQHGFENLDTDGVTCVGACMYLTCFTRGDCSFAVNQCARFMNNPGPSHIAAIKRVLRYLAGTKTRGITYKRNAGDSSADRAMVMWTSKRQPVTAVSSTES